MPAPKKKTMSKAPAKKRAPRKQSAAQTEANLQQDLGKVMMQVLDFSAMGGTTGGKIPKIIKDEKAWLFWRRWAFAASNASAVSLMMADVSAQTQNKNGEWEDDYDHPLSQLYRTINPYMTGAEFWYWVVADLEMSGTSYWQIIQNGLEEPAELMPLIGKVEPKLSKDGNTLENWLFTAEGQSKKIPLKAEEVLFLRYPNPRNFWGGYGPAQAAASELHLDDEAVQTIWSKFKRGVMPSAVLKMATKDEAKRQKYIAGVEDKLAGAKNAGKVMGIASTMDIDWVPTQNMIGDVKGWETLRDTILAVMRVPKEMLGMGVDANRASIWGMQFMFAKYKISPIAKLLEQRLDQSLSPIFMTDGRPVRTKFSGIVPEDAELRIKQETADTKNFVRSPNEIRATRALPESEWGARPIASVTVGPMLLGDERPTQTEEQKIDQHYIEMGAYTKKEREKIWKASHKGQEDLRQEIETGMFKIFAILEKSILKALEADREQLATKLPHVDKILDKKKLKAKIAKETSKISRKGVFLGGQFEQELLDPEHEFTDWSPSSEKAKEMTKQYGGIYNEEIASSTTREIKGTISKQVAKSATYDELRLAIIEKMGEMKTSRANSIATTETTRLWNAGGQGFREENEIEDKQWLASFVNTRETHVFVDSDVVANDKDFSVGSDRMQFPGGGSLAEENVNCLCVSVGFIKRKNS